MENIYLVVEQYGYDGEDEYKTTCFSTKEKAKEFFDKRVDDEKTSSWIKDCINDPYSYCDIVEEDYYFHIYNDLSFDETTIYIVEKEIL